ncbi:MAG: GTP cyclohydrolase I [Prevotella sp.]|nr:GTP cyclohydrolase I [Prevotella sp.]MBQ9561355.1 GTP cyclohydrolase I [Prevotella sp.]
MSNKISQEQVMDAIRTIMQYIGEDPEREGLHNTPERIVRMYDEIFRGYKPEMKPRISTFKQENGNGDESMVFDCGDYYSMCEHHMLPFFGKYYFAYIPNPEGRILGISKVARVVSYCAARLQLQEKLCKDVIEMLDDALSHTRSGKPLPPALGFAIVMKGHHTCKSMRGIKNKGDMTVSYFTGCFKKNRQLRNEFFDMIAMQG